MSHRSARTVSAVRKPIAVVSATRRRRPGFETASFHESRPWMDPYLAIDHFVMSTPTFPPHPHGGFSALTLLFEDSPGSLVNRDSLGNLVSIDPGDVHWTQAGAGVVHEEVPARPPIACHGAQIFVDLPAELEEAPPSVYHLDAAQVPIVPLDDGGRARVISGTLGDMRSPLGADTDATLLDVSLPPQGTAKIPVDPGHTTFALAVRGGGRAGPDGDEVLVAADQAVAFVHGDLVRIVAGDQGLHALVAGGRPLRQPVHWTGGFAMTTPARASAAARRHQAGQTGSLDPTF